MSADTRAEARAAIAAKFLRHVFDPNCEDCAADDYPCADHRQQCTNCGAEASIPGDLHRTKVDRKGQPIRVWWCQKCKGEPEPEWTYVNDKGEVR